MRNFFSPALSKRAPLRKYTGGFTLVELIVVVIILALLWAIWLVSFSNYSSGARDSTRVEDLTNLQKALAIAATVSVNGKYPLPDNGVPVFNSGALLNTQGYAWKNTLNTIKFNGAALDPLDSQFYTYSVNASQTGMALVAFLENSSNLTLVSYLPSLPRASAATTVDYSSRYPAVKGSSIGVLIASGTNQPLQATSTGIDLATTPNTTTYTVYIAPKVAITASGSTLATAISTAGSGMTSTGTVIYLVTGTCTGILTNAVYSNGLTSYSIQNAPSGTSLTGSYLTGTISPKSCQFNCIATYVWNGSACVPGTVTWPCTSLPSNANYYGGVTSYSLAAAPGGTTLSAVTAGYSATPTTNTCQYNCATNYGWNGSACVNVSGACTNLPSNAVYYSGGVGYSLTNAPYGTSLDATVAGYSASPTPNTCQYNCNTGAGYVWGGSSCINNITWACTSLPGGAVYYNNTSSYSLTAAPLGTTLNATTAGYSATPTVNTCQYKCASGYYWSGSSCTAYPTHNLVYVANADSNTVSVINGTNNTILATIPVGTTPYDAVYNPTTGKVYVVNASTVSVINPATNTVTATITGVGGTFIDVNPNTNKLYVYSGGNIVVIDCGSNTILSTVGAFCRGPIAMNPNTNTLCGGCGNDTILLNTNNYTTNDIGWGLGCGYNTANNTLYTQNWWGYQTNIINGTTLAGIGSYGGFDNRTGGRIVVNTTTGLVYSAGGCLWAYNGTTNVNTNVCNEVMWVVNSSTNKAYVTRSDNTVAVIDSASNTITTNVGVGSNPQGLAVVQ